MLEKIKKNILELTEEYSKLFFKEKNFVENISDVPV
jgi:hypothetical protein